MIVTFDECYDGNHDYLILGALFSPDHLRLHREFLKAKRNRNFVYPNGLAKEIKYSKVNSHYLYTIAEAAVDCFIQSPSWFRAMVVDQSPRGKFSLDYFGNPSEPRAFREAKAYKKFTELLLRSNLGPAHTNGTLLVDRLTRCAGDAFMQLVTELFGIAGQGYCAGPGEPIFKHIQEVDTALEQYHVAQIGDILQGVILAELVPPHNRFKRQICQCVKRKLGVPSLLQAYWEPLSKRVREEKHAKYQVWYWKPNK